MENIGRTESELRMHLQNVDQHPLMAKEKESQQNQTTLFADFECIYCEKFGSNNIDIIKEHMCDSHESDFLFIAARRSAKPDEDNGEAQLVYIGNSRDDSDGFRLCKCANPDDLDYMDATQLDVLMQIEILSQNRDLAGNELFTGQLPSIKFEEKNIAHISYESYLKLGCDTMQRVQSASHSFDWETSHQMPLTNQTQNISSVNDCNMEVQMETQSNQMVKSECGKVEFDPIELERTLAAVVGDGPTITYKCISTEMAKDLENAHKSSYPSLLCKYCTEFIKMDTKNGLVPLITHLENPVCKKKAKCTEISCLEKSMLQHRIKGKCDQKDEIVFLQEEKTWNTLVYKLVRCQFRCLAPLCPVTEKGIPFNNLYSLKKHHKDSHSLRYLRSAIIHKSTVIQSNDAEQPIGSVHVESQQYSLNDTFWCNRHGTNIGTRLCALEHHNNFHSKQNFEFSIKTVLLANKPVHNDDHKLVVLECEHCSKFFGSVESIDAHMIAIRKNNPNTALYTIKRLLVCAECKIVSTLDGLKTHYLAKHSEKALIPMHPIDHTCCGLCRAPVRNREKHYESSHQRGDTVNNKVLQSLGLNQIDLNNCQFTPGCCTEMRFSPIDNCINYILLCKHRLICIGENCSDVEPFQQPQGLATHRRIVHDEDTKQILNYIHDVKRVMPLLANMKIYFPNGFVTTKSAIEDTVFGDRLCKEIARSINVVFEREKAYIENLP